MTFSNIFFLRLNRLLLKYRNNSLHIEFYRWWLFQSHVAYPLQREKDRITKYLFSSIVQAFTWYTICNQLSLQLYFWTEWKCMLCSTCHHNFLLIPRMPPSPGQWQILCFVHFTWCTPAEETWMFFNPSQQRHNLSPSSLCLLFLHI